MILNLTPSISLRLFSLFFLYIRKISTDKAFLYPKVKNMVHDFIWSYITISPIRLYNLFVWIKVLKYHDHPIWVGDHIYLFKYPQNAWTTWLTLSGPILTNMDDAYIHSRWSLYLGILIKWKYYIIQWLDWPCEHKVILYHFFMQKGFLIRSCPYNINPLTKCSFGFCVMIYIYIERCYIIMWHYLKIPSVFWIHVDADKI